MSDERLKGNPVAAFLDQIELVGLDVPERLFQAAGPPDLDGVGASGFAQAKIGTQIALRQITSPTFDFPNLRNASGYNLNAGPHRVSIALCPDQPEVQEVVPVATTVVQKQRRISVVSHHHIDETVVVEVRERNSPAARRESGTRYPQTCLLPRTCRCVHCEKEN